MSASRRSVELRFNGEIDQVTHSHGGTRGRHAIADAEIGAHERTASRKPNARLRVHIGHSGIATVVGCGKYDWSRYAVQCQRAEYLHRLLPGHTDAFRLEENLGKLRLVEHLSPFHDVETHLRRRVHLERCRINGRHHLGGSQVLGVERQIRVEATKTRRVGGKTHVTCAQY